MFKIDSLTVDKNSDSLTMDKTSDSLTIDILRQLRLCSQLSTQSFVHDPRSRASISSIEGLLYTPPNVLRSMVFQFLLPCLTHSFKNRLDSLLCLHSFADHRVHLVWFFHVNIFVAWLIFFLWLQTFLFCFCFFLFCSVKSVLTNQGA